MHDAVQNNWKKDNLENLLDILIDHRGITPKKLGGDWSSNGIPALSAKNIKTGNIVNEQDIRFVNQILYDKWMPEKLEDGDILLTSEAPLGELYFLKNKKDYVLSQRLFALRSNKNKLNPRYLYYYLQGSIGQQELLRRLSGTAAEGIRQAELRKISVEFPEDVSEQRKIASIISFFDDKIELNNKISKTLEEMALAIFKEWFVNFHFPGFGKTKFVDSELGKIPDGWETIKLEKYARLEYGKSLQAEKRINGDVVVYGSSGKVGTHTKKLCSGPGIVVGRKGNVGSVFWVNENFYPIDTTFYVSTEKSIYYVYFILKNLRFHTGDSAVPGLNRDSVHNEDIIIPDAASINKFESFVIPLFEKRNLVQKENKKLEALRDLLLPKLMKGEIRI